MQLVEIKLGRGVTRGIRYSRIHEMLSEIKKMGRWLGNVQKLCNCINIPSSKISTPYFCPSWLMLIFVPTSVKMGRWLDNAQKLCNCINVPSSKISAPYFCPSWLMLTFVPTSVNGVPASLAYV
jgi:hypothetical protein